MRITPKKVMNKIKMSENERGREMGGGVGYGGGFALIVVLFILLVIVGASWWY